MICDRIGITEQEPFMNRTVLGIDVAKSSFHAALLERGSKERVKSFPNNSKGFDQLANWIRNRKVEHVHACLEASGGWSEALAADLHDRGHVVSLVNPQRIKAFGASEGLRTKTDAIDAALIARFCVVHEPPAWTPPSREIRALQSLWRRRESLIDIRTQELNRLQGPESDPSVRNSLTDHIAYLDEEIKDIEQRINRTIDDDPKLRGQRDLIATIPGLGKTSASAITAEFPNMEEYRDGNAVAAYAGLCPKLRESGTSLRRSTLSRVGNARLRTMLFFPALAAMRHNANIRAFADRLRARGKHKMVIVAAAMRKLLVLAYGVVKSGRPFDPLLTQ
jgi:transposase